MKLNALKVIINFSKYRNFSGGNFSLTLSIFVENARDTLCTIEMIRNWRGSWYKYWYERLQYMECQTLKVHVFVE